VTVAAEVAAVEQLHQAAQARLGIAAAYLALSEWKSVNANNPDETSQTWILVSIRIIVAVRKLSRQLAINYYQLVRGLETGSTLGAPANSTGNVTLGDLRKNFRDMALDVAALPSPRTVSDDPDIRCAPSTPVDPAGGRRGGSADPGPAGC
jgi:Flp pilus assembly secretin CpaC